MAIKKILVVGHGSIGIRHLTMINTIFNHNIDIGILRRKNGGDFQFVRYFTDYREAMIWNPCFVVIASPSNTHADYLNKFRNSHILVEKPAVISKKELGIMKSFDNNKMLKVGYNYRYHPEFSNMKNYVLKNKIYLELFKLSYDDDRYLKILEKDKKNLNTNEICCILKNDKDFIKININKKDLSESLNKIMRKVC